MTLTISVNAEHINNLDLSWAREVIEKALPIRDLSSENSQLSFEIDFPGDPNDPRELSEIPEVRLWFIRLDTVYPWLPLLLDWRSGELARYVAMLVPHQFHPTNGIQYNPEALEIFVMEKIFISLEWLKQQEIEGRSRLKSMVQMLGYELDDAFFDLVESKQ